jgi:uncharacterized protein YcbX
MGRIQTIYRYPVKGLSAEPLPGTSLKRAESVPGDRLYAIENGPCGFDPAAPRHFPKQHFLMLMRNERLAELRASFDRSCHTLSLAREGREVARGDLTTQNGRAAIERYFGEFYADALRGPPKILHAPGHSFSDVAGKVVSIINLDSLAALARVVRAPIDPLRFRANVYIAGWPAWSERELVGKVLAAGPRARLKVVKRINRCAATNVDPQTGARDLDLPQTLRHTYGRDDCGVYAEVIADGDIAPGDPIDVV